MQKTNIKNNYLLTAILYILVGALLCIFRAGSLSIMLTIIGILFIAYGIYDIVNKNYNDGVINIVIGLVIILGGWLFIELIMIVFGILLATKGVMNLIDAIKDKNVSNIAISVLTIIVGILLVISHWAMLDWFFIIIGVILMVDGGIALYKYLKK